MTKPKTATDTPAKAKTDRTEAKMDALYHAVMEMRGGHDAALKKAFEDKGAE